MSAFKITEEQVEPKADTKEKKQGKQDDSFNQSMLQEIEVRTSHLNNNELASEIESSKQQETTKTKPVIPKINLDKLQDKNGKDLEGPLDQMNQS